jgi:hypothetical protein
MIPLFPVLFLYGKIPVYPFLNNTSMTTMECGILPPYLRYLAGAITKGMVLVVVLPLAAAIIFAQPLTSTIALITSTLIIEYGAAPVGLGLGLPPVFVFYVLVCVALGVILSLFDIFDLLGVQSKRVARFLEKSAERAKHTPVLTKYGIYSLVPCVLTLGFYICPPISWVLGWRRDLSILLIMAGYIAISMVTILATMGIFWVSQVN